MFFRTTAAVILLAVSSGAAVAGEQYVDETGYALSGYDVVAYRGLEQTPVGEPQPDPVPGKSSITAEHNGATWAFASEANKQKFLADPEKLSPGSTATARWVSPRAARCRATRTCGASSTAICT